MPPRERLDVLLYERGLTDSREKARRLILAGQVEVEGIADPKPGLRVPLATQMRIRQAERYVSRGGLKLEAALSAFDTNPAGLVCADIGASTGGFTDCLLQHGAARVYAVDVGVSQIHEKLRHDPRVILVEHTNARDLGSTSLPERPALLAVDVSFISLAKVLPSLARVAADRAHLIALIKPQFEATRTEVSRGKGIIRSPEAHMRILHDIISQAPQWGWLPLALAPSPIAGGSGNREYLMHAAAAGGSGDREPPPDIDIDGLVRKTLMGSTPHEPPRDHSQSGKARNREGGGRDSHLGRQAWDRGGL